MAKSIDRSTRDPLDSQPQDARLMACYETLLSLSGKMLDLATRGEWEALIEEEGRYLMAVDQLQQQQEPAGLSREQQQRRAAMVELILEQSLEVQRHLVARRDLLGRLIGVAGVKKAVDRAYLSEGKGEPGDLLT